MTDLPAELRERLRKRKAREEAEDGLYPDT